MSPPEPYLGEVPRTPVRHHILSVLVENKAGVLSRVAGLFSRRGFNIYSLAVAPTDDLSFDGLVGKGAALRVGGGAGRDATRIYRGVCTRVELLRVEPSGLSTYALSIAPALSLLAHRTNHRLFQHLSAPEIAKVVGPGNQPNICSGEL